MRISVRSSATAADYKRRRRRFLSTDVPGGCPCRWARRLDRCLAVRAHLTERLERRTAVDARLPELRRADRADEEAQVDLRAADGADEPPAREPVLHRLDLELPLAHIREVLGRTEEHVDERTERSEE